jgi:hypothetical protein
VAADRRVPTLIRMRPLQSIAMGLLVVSLNASFSGYDALANPIGWVLVLLGVRGLPADVERKNGLLWAAGLAGLASVPLWFPDLVEALNDRDASLSWAANLPQLAFVILLMHTLARRAVAHADPGAGSWMRTVLVGLVLGAVLPVIAFASGSDGIAVLSVLVVTLAMLTMIVLLFRYAARPWATVGAGAGQNRAIAPE